MITLRADLLQTSCRSCLLAGLGALLLLGQARADVLYGLDYDATITQDEPELSTDGGGLVNDAFVGHLSSGRAESGNSYGASVFVFQLPDFGTVSAPFQTAQFRMTLRATNSIDAHNPGIAHDLYGLGARDSHEVLESDFYVGSKDATDATLLKNNLVNAKDVARFSTNVPVAGGGEALVAYLNAQYAGGAGAGKYVFLRLNVDALHASPTEIRIHPADSLEDERKPQIEFTTNLSASADVP